MKDDKCFENPSFVDYAGFKDLNNSLFTFESSVKGGTTKATIKKDCGKDFLPFYLKNSYCKMGLADGEYDFGNVDKYDYKFIPLGGNPPAFKIFDTNCSAYAEMSDPS